VYQPYYYYPPGYPYPYSYPAGTLTVTSYPSGAVVILDGYNFGTTPYIFTGLTTGYHTVEVDYPGYEAYINNVYIDNGASAAINADLTQLLTYGSMLVRSTPTGADVYVDGNYQGTSPVTVSALAAGRHQVELHLAGYEVLTSRQNVNGGQGTVVDLVLTPYTFSSEYGSIDVTSDIPGALVYLDGIYKGSTPSGKVFNIISVSPGDHTLLLHVPGSTDFTQTVTVTAGKITYVRATFNAVSSVQPGSVTSSSGAGSVIVTSNPAGGEVYVDNQFRGVAPVTIYNLATGSHIVNMKLAGYSDWSSSVDVQANQMQTVAATFVPGNGTIPVSTRAGVSPAIILGALAVGIIAAVARTRR
jgi:hypothetical protein